MDLGIDPMDSAQDLGAPELLDVRYASVDTLHSSVAFLRTTLAGLGFGDELNLLSTEPAAVVGSCNTIYGLLLQYQRDAKFRERLKQDMQRMRVDLQMADKERGRLEARLQAKEREIGGLQNKTRIAEEQRKEEVRAAKREADDLQKKLVGYERRVVQMQHEIKRKEKEYERLQEKLAHYLADKRKHESALLDMAGKLTQQLQVGGQYSSGALTARSARAAASDEGLRAVVAAYEQKQGELTSENADLKAALGSLQAEYKEQLNRQVRRQQAEASSGAEAAVEDAFLRSVPSMSEEELRSELGSRLKLLQRRLNNLSSAGASEKDFQSASEQRLFGDLRSTQGVVRDQERLIAAVLSALRGTQQAKEQQHQADMRRMAQHYQGQLAAAEGEITRAKEAQAEAARGELESLRSQLQETQASLQRKSEAEHAACEQQAAAEQQCEALQRRLAAAQQAAAAAAAAATEGKRTAAAATAAAAAAAAAAEEGMREGRAALGAQQREAAAAAKRFELLRKNYEELMRKYAPGVGAGIFLERAVARKATEVTDSEMREAAAASADCIPAGR